MTAVTRTPELERSEPAIVRRTSRLWTALALALLPNLIITVYFWHVGVSANLFETGTTLNGGTRALNGEALYRDVFAFYGPLAYLVPATTAAVFGHALQTLVLLDAILTTLGVAVGFALVRALTRSFPAAIVAGWVLAAPGLAWQRTSIPVLAICCIALAVRTSHRRWAFGAGAATAVALFWWQDSGIFIGFATVGCCVLLARRRSERTWLRRMMPVWLAGGLTIALPFIGYYAVIGVLQDWFYYCFIFPNTVYGDRSATEYLVGQMHQWQGSSIPTLAYKYLFYIGPYAFVFGFAALSVLGLMGPRFRRTLVAPDELAIGVLAVYALLQTRVMLASLDDAKLATVAGPTVLLLLILGHRSWLSLRAGRFSGQSAFFISRLTQGAVMGSFLLLVFCFGQRTLHNVMHASDDVQRAPGNVLINLVGGAPPQTSLADLADLVSAVQAQVPKDGHVFFAPTQPLLYTLVDRRNATRWDYLDPIYTTSAIDAEIANDLAGDPPELIVLADNTFAGGTLSVQDLAPTTYNWITSHYRATEVIGHFTLWSGS